MSDWAHFILAVLALLATPGPTNTLMAASGAQRGVPASLPLLLGELGGYAIAITVWIELVGAASASGDLVPMVARLGAAIILLWLAWKMWKGAGQKEMPQGGISGRRVFVTTLINPKALVFAFAVFPPTGFLDRLPFFGVFALLVVGTACAWMGLGAFAAHGARGLLTPSRIERLTSVVFAAFAAMLVVQTLGR